MRRVSVSTIAAVGICLGVCSVNTFAEPSAVPVGSGSYAEYPPVHEGEDPADMLVRTIYVTDPAARAIPTNDWWTDLVASRYAGTMWAYPLAVSADEKGLDIYFPTSFNSDGSAMVTELPLQIHGEVPPNPNPNDIVIADFENGVYPAGWEITGNAFGNSPANGSFAGQMEVKGFLGTGLVNSYYPNDGNTGGMLSPEFVINRDYLHFLIAGGNHPGETEVRLIVNDTIVRSTTGDNSENLKWVVWDLSDESLQGATAQVEIVDLSTGGWGHVCADQLVLSDDIENPQDGYSTSFSPEDARAADWSDWLVRFRMAKSLDQYVDVTMGHGLPYIWLEFSGVSPKIVSNATARYFMESGDVTSFPLVTDHLGLEYGGCYYAIFAPDGTEFDLSGDTLAATFTGPDSYLVVGAMPAEGDLATLYDCAYAIPRTTTMEWRLDREKSEVITTWSINTEALRGSDRDTMQGWIPHHYGATTNDLVFNGLEYLTPRGVLKCTTGTEFNIVFPFQGILPNLPAPEVLGNVANDYDPRRMATYVGMYATKSDYGADTYWGGKDLVRFARYMSFAHEMGHDDFQTLRANLKTALTDWLTYTEGETEYYFARYPNWGALVGFNESYYSYAFTDHHFHYGYFVTAAALLGMYDGQFLADYGDMIKLVAKEYANWDRNDDDYPFLRTFDVWNGHSYAGGLSSPGGNNQESSSEAMQSWGGLFLLGEVLGDEVIAAAGAMGHAMEAAAISEYWLDYPGYLGENSNYSNNYDHEITGILFDSGQAYATYFSADPAWVAGIQWLPISPMLNYLVRDPEFARWQYEQMMEERVEWLAPETSSISQMGASLGNVILGYLQLFDPGFVAAKMDELWEARDPVATDNYTGGITYYFTHANRMLGDIQWQVHCDVPTSQIYHNENRSEYSYVIYNPRNEHRLARVYINGSFSGFVHTPPKSLIHATDLLMPSSGFSVLATSPVDGGEVADAGEIAVVFSKPPDVSSLAACTVTGPGATGLGYLSTSDDLLVVFAVEGDLQPGENYQITIPVAITAQSGDSLAADYVFSFMMTELKDNSSSSFLNAHYKLDEASGTTVFDSSDHGYDGLYVNDPSLGQAGVAAETASAIDFDGQSAYATLESAYILGIMGDFTATAWINPDSVVGDNPILGTDNIGNSQGLHLALRNGKPYFSFYANDTTGNASIQPGNWYHLAFRFRGGEQAVFVNGVLDVASKDHSGFVGFELVLIGRSRGADGSPYMFDGRIDDVQIYDRALTDLEIELLHENPGSVNTDGLQNFPPEVDAGIDQSVTSPESANLVGSVIDDGLPNPPASVNVLWTMESGPGSVVFEDATSLLTTATFSATGTYVLRLTAFDGELMGFDEVSVTLAKNQDLIAHYKLEETGGDLAEDSSGNGLHGQFVGNPSLNQTGAAPGTGTSVAFDGNTQEVSFGTPALFNELVNDFTISMWFNPITTAAATRVLFGASWEDYNGWSLRISGQNLCLERLGPTFLYDSQLPITAGSWYHAVAVYDTDNSVTFYVNGQYVLTVTGAEPASSATRPWFLASNGTNEKFHGLIDDVQIYRRALHMREVEFLYMHPGMVADDLIVPGDCDHDLDVDLDDLAGIESCLSGPGNGLNAGCTCFDLDGNGEITLHDFAYLQVAFGK